ncbi:MAG: ROK family protein [Acidimicrobiia bacterium]|nr:ROK family protein [Acidimicrobiia bacterium]
MTTPGLAAGIDVGGTKILGVVVDAAGRTVAETRRPTPRGTPALIDDLVATADELVASVGAVDGIGVGVPGLITTAGTLRSSPNLPGIERLDVAGELATRLARPVAVGNDATCATLAEWQLGAGRGVDDLVLVTLGTGIGGGIVTGGRLVVGANGFAGEFGHMVVDPNGLRCPCGRRGCWERYASGSGISALARNDALAGGLSAVVERAGGDAALVRGEHVQAAALEGDVDALDVVDQFARWVAIGLANLTNAFDPAAFVLGGGLAVGADVFLEPIQRWFTATLYAPEHRPHPALTFATLGEHAGAIGAALLTR